MNGIEQPLFLAPMAHLLEAKCAEDDWSGVSDRSRRKQRQNRLNQRAYRHRKARRVHDQSQSQRPGQDVYMQYDHTGIYQHYYRAPNLYQIEDRQAVHKESGLSLSSNSFTKGEQPRPVFQVNVAFKKITFDIFTYFPLSSDHLLSLIRYNLYRAVAANSWSLGIDPQLMHSDIASPFVSKDSALSAFCLSLPPALQPTELQKKLPHHPYIDLFPFPQLRDCLLQVTNTIDEDQLCADFAGENVDSDSREHTGLIVWGEPWDPSSWEIGESMWKKWSWLFRESPEALRATNYWRQRRGEPCIEEIP